MKFARKKKRGQNQKVRRTWFSEEGYRIVWRKEVCGVRVPARFQACVRVLIPCNDGQLRPMWDFVNFHRRLMKTMKAAQEECEKHQHLWTKACGATGIRALKDLFGGKLPSGLPVWARKNMDRRLYAILTDNRPGNYRTDDDEEDESCTENSSRSSDAPGLGGPTRTSECSALPTEATSENPTPSSPAEGKDRSTTPRTRRARSKDTETPAAAVPSAKEAGKGRKKPATKRTKPVSKRTARRKLNTTGSSDSAKPRSHGSRKTKLLPSAS